MSLTASVVSAAILEGNLIIGLSDGSVINCGYVQGPPGLQGNPGPMGADGDAGRDGNTIITVAGTPRNDAGKDGDYAIDNVNWRIYGPKAGGVWGKANDMLPSKDNLIVNGRGFEGGAGGSGDSGGGGGGGTIQQILGGDGIDVSATSNPAILEVSADIDTDKGLEFFGEQIAINIGTGLTFNPITGAIEALNSSVTVGPDEPINPDEGDLWWNNLGSEQRLYVYIGSTGAWVLASPERITVGLIEPNPAEEGDFWYDTNADQNELKVYVGTSWVPATPSATGALEARIATNESDIADIQGQLSDFADKDYVDGVDEKLQNQIDELQIQKGAAAIYTCKNIDPVPVPGFNPRAGQWGANDGASPDVTQLTLGDADKAGTLTKTINDGDIIEINGIGGDTRYKVLDATAAPLLVLVEYISGNQGFVVDNDYTFYIYPQNEAGATKEYVDQQDSLKLNLAGGVMTGKLEMTGQTPIEARIIDTAQNTNLELKRNGSTKVYVGNDQFQVKEKFLAQSGAEIAGDVDIVNETSAGVRILGALKVKKTGSSISGSNSFEAFGNYASYYGLIDQDNHIATKKYVDDHAGGGVELHNNSTPPSTRDRGTLLMTTSNVLYIYTA